MEDRVADDRCAGGAATCKSTRDERRAREGIGAGRGSVAPREPNAVRVGDLDGRRAKRLDRLARLVEKGGGVCRGKLEQRAERRIPGEDLGTGLESALAAREHHV